MNVCLIGYGKMGKAIEMILTDRGHAITGKIGRQNVDSLTPILKKSDVAIEFTGPQSAVSNIMTCFENQVPVVCGSTGWLTQLEQITLAAAKLQGTLLYASNFSVGVNLFFALNKQLARLMAPYETYAITLTETHHIHKKDIPSGTAIQLAEDVLSENKRFTSWGLASEHDEAKLKIVAHREDEVIGTHSIAYVSEIDKIELKHEAFNRTGFAMGAVLATEWIFEKQGVYTMKDMLGLY